MNLSSTVVKDETTYYTEYIHFSKVSLVIWFIDDYTKRLPFGNIKVIIDGEYLFSWEEIPGKDNNKLIEFLKQHLGINWIQPNDIKKDGTTISISDGANLLSLELDEEKKKINLKIKNSVVNEFTVRKENSKIKVYKERNILPVKNLSGYYIFHDLRGGIYSVNVESDFYFDDERTIDASRLNDSDVSLKFEKSGPSKNKHSVQLENASNLRVGDIVEFRNPYGKIEQRSINGIDTSTNTISWEDKLKNDYSEDSTVVLLKYLLIEISLKPKPSYPFSNNATLVRGYISKKVPVDNVSVKVVGENLITATDKNGEFVLYFNDITEEGKKITIEIENGSNLPAFDKKLIIGGTLNLGRIEFP